MVKTIFLGPGLVLRLKIFTPLNEEVVNMPIKEVGTDGDGDYLR
jgi:hypothetical protein